MKQYILLLVLMVMGAGIHAYAEDVNPVKVRGEKRNVSICGRPEND